MIGSSLMLYKISNEYTLLANVSAFMDIHVYTIEEYIPCRLYSQWSLLSIDLRFNYFTVRVPAIKLCYVIAFHAIGNTD